MSTESPQDWEEIAKHYREIIKGLGEDPDREGLLDTPKRAAKAMQFLNRGYTQDLETVVNNAMFESDNEEIVLVKDIELYSLCEHHLLPFVGKCHVGYLPKGRVIGLSKIARIVDMFARRLQIQENLSRQIADAIQSSTDAAGVGVIRAPVQKHARDVMPDHRAGAVARQRFAGGVERACLCAASKSKTQ